MGLITLSIVYEVFKAKINTPEFKAQLTEEDLHNLILDIEFDILYDKHQFKIEFEYLSKKIIKRFSDKKFGEF